MAHKAEIGKTHLRNKAIEVGHPILDEQRQNLLYLAEVLLDLGKDVTGDPEIFMDTLSELTQQAEFHFCAEEDYLAEQNHSCLEVQREAHHQCKSYLLSCFKCSERTIRDRKLVGEITHSKITSHITKDDLLYRDLNTEITPNYRDIL